MSPTSVQSRFILAQQQQKRAKQQEQQQQQRQEGSNTMAAAGLQGSESAQKSESLEEAACRREATLGAIMDWAFGSNGPKANSTWESSRNALPPLQSTCVASGECGLIGSLGLPLLTGSHWPRFVFVDGRLLHPAPATARLSENP